MNVFETVRENVTAIDVVTMAGIKPNRSKMICCPFHNDKRPSMKVDNQYYCFGCGAKGDAIDFVANYYGLGLKAAAEKIATDFVLAYDDKRYSENIQKIIIPKKTEYQIWAERKRELFANLSRLHEKLRQMKIKYEPKIREDSDWSPLFSLAVKEFIYVDYLYDYCMFEATEEELKKEYEAIVKELKKLRKELLTQNQELVDQLLDKSEMGWSYSTIENAKVILENDELFKDNMKITKNFFIFCCRTLFPLMQSTVSFWKEIFK